MPLRSAQDSRILSGFCSELCHPGLPRSRGQRESETAGCPQHLPSCPSVHVFASVCGISSPVWPDQVLCSHIAWVAAGHKDQTELACAGFGPLVLKAVHKVIPVRGASVWWEARAPELRYGDGRSRPVGAAGSGRAVSTGELPLSWGPQPPLHQSRSLLLSPFVPQSSLPGICVQPTLGAKGTRRLLLFHQPEEGAVGPGGRDPPSRTTGLLAKDHLGASAELRPLVGQRPAEC